MERDIKTVNTWNIYRDVDKLLQPIKDKKKNIGRLNQGDFPLKKEEITNFLIFIESGIYDINNYFHNLHYYYLHDTEGICDDPDEVCGNPDNLCWDAKVRFYRAIGKARIVPDTEIKEIETLMMDLKLILLEGNKRDINNLKKKIKVLKSEIWESKKYEDSKTYNSKSAMTALVANTLTNGKKQESIKNINLKLIK